MRVYIFLKFFIHSFDNICKNTIDTSRYTVNCFNQINGNYFIGPLFYATFHIAETVFAHRQLY